MRVAAPQIIYTALVLFSMGVAAARFGQPKKDNYDIIDCLLGPAASIGLLYWGGFYG